MLRQQKGFDWFKFVTISMVVVGVGVLLISLILPRYVWRDENLGLDGSQENQDTAETSAVQSPHKVVSRESLNQSGAQQPIDDSKSREGKSTTEPTVSSEEIRGEAMDTPSGGVDSPEKNSDPEKVKAVVARIYEKAENYRQILIRRRDLFEGRAHLHPESASPGFSEEESQQYVQAQLSAQDLFSDYIRLTGDYDAFNSGGWINQAFSGLARLSGSSATRNINVFFSDDMITYHR